MDFGLVLARRSVPTDYGAGIVVNSLADTTVAGDGQYTLREAINNANVDAERTRGDCQAGKDADVITFSVTGTIQMAGLAFDIVGDLAIRGPERRISWSTGTVGGLGSSRAFSQSSWEAPLNWKG